MFPRTLFVLFCIPGMLLRAADDPREIVRHALQANNDKRELKRSYTFTERDEERTLDGAGKVKHTKSEVWDVIPLQGAQFRRLTQRDDKPLSAKEEQQQEASRQKQEAERKKRQEERDKETPAQRQKRLDARERARKQQQAETDDIVAGFDLTLLGDEQVDGMPVWVIEGAPRKGYKFKFGNSAFSKAQGRIWISKADYQPVRIDVEITATVSIGLVLARIYKGTRYQVEFTYVNNEVWLPKHEKGTISARVGLVKGWHMEEEDVYTNYKKFTADSRVIGIDQ